MQVFTSTNLFFCQVRISRYTGLTIVGRPFRIFSYNDITFGIRGWEFLGQLFDLMNYTEAIATETTVWISVMGWILLHMNTSLEFQRLSNFEITISNVNLHNVYKSLNAWVSHLFGWCKKPRCAQIEPAFTWSVWYTREINILHDLPKEIQYFSNPYFKISETIFIPGSFRVSQFIEWQGAEYLWNILAALKCCN